MYREYPDGTTEEIQGLTVNIPKKGWVYNPVTKNMEFRGCLSRSKTPKYQHWERMKLPDDWLQRRNKERDRQEKDPDYVDLELEAIRQEAWDRRLCGLWFLNNGEPTYVTGLHCFYLDWIYISNTRNDGYPDYWESDRKFFYFLDYCINDPRSIGCIAAMKRRAGKTAKSIAFLLDLTTRSKEKFGGIQSKTDMDASKIVFEKGVVKAFKKLPDFFVPLFDTNSTLKKSIDFLDTPAKGKKAQEEKRKLGAKKALGGGIDYRSSKETAYDGSILHRYVADEIFKTENVDIRERHDVVKFCCTDTDGNYIGKILCTSTVEEIEGDTDTYVEFWDGSDPSKRNEVTGRTETGLYRFFLPSDEARDRDIYGFCNPEKNRTIILANRESVRHDQKKYNSLVRKEPLTIEEAFRFSAGGSIFDSMILNDRLDFLSWQDQDKIYTTGDLVWLNGERDTEVVFRPKPNGKFKVLNYLTKDPTKWNKINTLGETKYPAATREFVVGIDPFSHNNTEDKRSSKGAAYGYCKFDPNNDHSSTFVIEYCHRPPTAAIFFEDMVLLCHFLGCKAMIENNKIGIVRYFEDRGYSAFLYKLKKRKEPGLPSSKQMHQRLAEVTEDYQFKNIDKVWFVDLIKDWLKFDINKTTQFDRTMSAGFTLIGNDVIKTRREKPELDIHQIIRQYNVNG